MKISSPTVVNTAEAWTLRVKGRACLGLPGDGCHLADFLCPEGVYDGALPSVGVPNETNTESENNRSKVCG